MSGLPITVDWATGDAMSDDPWGMAMAAGEHADYTPDSGKVELAPYESEGSVAVAVNDDGFDEHDETFMVTISNATTTGPDAPPISDAEATGEIVDDDDPPTVSFAGDVHGAEGSGALTFVLNLDNESGLPISVDIATGDYETPLDEWGMATAGDDYMAIDATYTIEPHEDHLHVDVDLVADELDEHPEQFSISLSNAMNATPGDTHAVGTIQDDDDSPSLSISDASGGEADGPLSFMVSLSGASGLPIGVHVATGDAPMAADEHHQATAGVDYTAVSELLEFAPGETEKMVMVDVIDDMHDERDEMFAVTLNDGMYATLGDAEGIGTIMDDDDAPMISIADASAAEGAGEVVFTVSLDAASGLPVSVHYATGDMMAPEGDYTAASAGSDYTASSGTVVIEAGATEAHVSVALLDDAMDEMDEHFAITLSQPVDGMFADGAESVAATGTIMDDEDHPSVSIADARSDEAAGSLSFAVTLSAASGLPVHVDWATGDAETDDMYGMATADMDYASGGGTLHFAPGQTHMTVEVAVMEDALDEHEEVFAVHLSNAMHAMLGDAMAEGRIMDNDAAPMLSVADASAAESAGELSFMVSLDAESALPISVHWMTADASGGDMYGMATADVDYAAGSGMVEFAPGDTEMMIAVAVMDDALDEHDEMFAVNLHDAAYATLDDGSAVGTIEDDDDAPSVSIADASGPESVGHLHFAVTLSAASGLPVTVDWATASGTAKAGEDYENADGTLTVAAGDTGGTVSVAIVADDVHEAEETFSVMLSGAMYSTLDDASATGTITDDDAAPTWSVADASAAESDGHIHFTVSLAGATALPASVSWGTAPGSATAGEDYQTASGSFTYQPGEARSMMVSVMIHEDDLYEGVETFSLNLSGPGNSTLAAGSATGTISDNDAESIAKEWLARFGRTVATHVVDAVDARLNSAVGAGNGGSELRLSGIGAPTGVWGAPIGQSFANPGFGNP